MAPLIHASFMLWMLFSPTTMFDATQTVLFNSRCSDFGGFNKTSVGGTSWHAESRSDWPSSQRSVWSLFTPCQLPWQPISGRRTTAETFFRSCRIVGGDGCVVVAWPGHCRLLTLAAKRMGMNYCGDRPQAAWSNRLPINNRSGSTCRYCRSACYPWRFTVGSGECLPRVCEVQSVPQRCQWIGQRSSIKPQRIHPQGLRFAMCAALGSLICLSLVSGKQAYYLIPAMPMTAICLAWIISRCTEQVTRAQTWFMGIGTVLVGFTPIVLSHLSHENSASRTGLQSLGHRRIHDLRHHLSLSKATISFSIRPRASDLFRDGDLLSAERPQQRSVETV